MNDYIIPILIAAAFILLMLLLFRYLMKGEAPADNKRVKVRKKTKHSKAEKKKEKKKGRADKRSRLPVIMAEDDDSAEKYAKIASDFLSTRYGTVISKMTLRKYYSERHGFECVDFIYELKEGLTPSQFRNEINSIDLALSNVSGVDTLTFQISDMKPEVFKTTFYLGK